MWSILQLQSRLHSNNGARGLIFAIGATTTLGAQLSLRIARVCKSSSGPGLINVPSGFPQTEIWCQRECMAPLHRRAGRVLLRVHDYWHPMARRSGCCFSAEPSPPSIPRPPILFFPSLVLHHIHALGRSRRLGCTTRTCPPIKTSMRFNPDAFLGRIAPQIRVSSIETWPNTSPYVDQHPWAESFCMTDVPCLGPQDP